MQTHSRPIPRADRLAPTALRPAIAPPLLASVRDVAARAHGDVLRRVVLTIAGCDVLLEQSVAAELRAALGEALAG